MTNSLQMKKAIYGGFNIVRFYIRKKFFETYDFEYKNYQKSLIVYIILYGKTIFKLKAITEFW